MTKAIVKGFGLAAMASALVLGVGSSPGFAHNDWGLPLLGGLVGGYGLSSIMHREQRPRAEPVYVAPPPVYAAPAAPAVPAAAAPSAGATAAGIEHQLNVLDDLAAKGYITPDEDKSRRQALLNQI